MSEHALRQRLANLTNLDKLHSFIQVLLLKVLFVRCRPAPNRGSGDEADSRRMQKRCVCSR